MCISVQGYVYKYNRSSTCDTIYVYKRECMSMSIGNVVYKYKDMGTTCI